MIVCLFYLNSISLGLDLGPIVLEAIQQSCRTCGLQAEFGQWKQWKLSVGGHGLLHNMGSHDAPAAA